MHNFDEMEKRGLGLALKQARKAAGIKTQKELFQKTDIPIETIRSWEQGRKTPQLPQLLTLCELYSCDLDYLVGRIECRTHEIQDMHSYIGLSEETIEKLHKWKRTNCFTALRILDKLIASKWFFKSLRDAWNYSTRERRKKNSKSEKIVIDTDGLIPDVLLFQAARHFSDCLEDTFGQK